MRDPAGNESTTAFDARVFAKPFKASRIPIDDAFMARVVPVSTTSLNASSAATARPVRIRSMARE